MPGRIIDLSKSGVRLPTVIAVDTNLIATRLLAAYFPPHIEAAERAYRFFSILRSQDVAGALTPTVCQEFFHLALRGTYQLALPRHRSVLATEQGSRRGMNWETLYKFRPDLIDEFLPELERFVPTFRFNRLTVIQPQELTPPAASRRIETELLRLVGRYQLDTNDAAILMEAQRAGIGSIATLDADLRRAALDFDVYTWL